MSLNDELEIAIKRVRKMEEYLDEVIYMLNHDRQSLFYDAELKEKVEMLSDYYSNGIWLSDYDRDCRGEFPVELKRGVLAQDTLYNLLMEIQQEK